MREIVERGAPFERQVWDRNEAIASSKPRARSTRRIIRDLPETETITVYSQGDWIDLCRGPHFPTTKSVGKAFKLTKLAGAYWRGDHRNAQLQRIYGTAWATESAARRAPQRIEEAEKRDHRRVGRTMDLFHFQEEGPGHGVLAPARLDPVPHAGSYMRRRLEARATRRSARRRCSTARSGRSPGHWQLYGKNMFVARDGRGRDPGREADELPRATCRCSTSARRATATCRCGWPSSAPATATSPSGSLHGLMRVRQFVQDDAHIFCREDQVTGGDPRLRRAAALGLRTTSPCTCTR
jgi:threonyl-tRNA synthetase